MATEYRSADGKYIIKYDPTDSIGAWYFSTPEASGYSTSLEDVLSKGSFSSMSTYDASQLLQTNVETLLSTDPTMTVGTYVDLLDGVPEFTTAMGEDLVDLANAEGLSAQGVADATGWNVDDINTWLTGNNFTLDADATTGGTTDTTSTYAPTQVLGGTQGEFYLSVGGQDIRSSAMQDLLNQYGSVEGVADVLNIDPAYLEEKLNKDNYSYYDMYQNWLNNNGGTTGGTDTGTTGGTDTGTTGDTGGMFGLPEFTSGFLDIWNTVDSSNPEPTFNQIYDYWNQHPEFSGDQIAGILQGTNPDISTQEVLSNMYGWIADQGKYGPYAAAFDNPTQEEANAYINMINSLDLTDAQKQHLIGAALTENPYTNPTDYQDPNTGLYGLFGSYMNQMNGYNPVNMDYYAALQRPSEMPIDEYYSRLMGQRAGGILGQGLMTAQPTPGSDAWNNQIINDMFPELQNNAVGAGDGGSAGAGWNIGMNSSGNAVSWLNPETEDLLLSTYGALEDVPLLTAQALREMAGYGIDQHMDAIDAGFDLYGDWNENGMLVRATNDGAYLYSPEFWNSTSDAPSWNAEGNIWEGWGYPTTDTTTSSGGGSNDGYSGWTGQTDGGYTGERGVNVPPPR